MVVTDTISCKGNSVLHVDFIHLEMLCSFQYDKNKTLAIHSMLIWYVKNWNMGQYEKYFSSIHEEEGLVELTALKILKERTCFRSVLQMDY